MTRTHLLDRHADCCQCAAFLPGIELSHILGSSTCPRLQCLRLLHTHQPICALLSAVADLPVALPLLVADLDFALPSVVADLTFALLSPYWQPIPDPYLLRQAVAWTVETVAAVVARQTLWHRAAHLSRQQCSMWQSIVCSAQHAGLMATLTSNCLLTQHYTGHARRHSTARHMACMTP